MSEQATPQDTAKMLFGIARDFVQDIAKSVVEDQIKPKPEDKPTSGDKGWIKAFGDEVSELTNRVTILERRARELEDSVSTLSDDPVSGAASWEYVSGLEGRINDLEKAVGRPVEPDPVRREARERLGYPQLPQDSDVPVLDHGDPARQRIIDAAVIFAKAYTATGTQAVPAGYYPEEEVVKAVQDAGLLE